MDTPLAPSSCPHRRLALPRLMSAQSLGCFSSGTLVIQVSGAIHSKPCIPEPVRPLPSIAPHGRPLKNPCPRGRIRLPTGTHVSRTQHLIRAAQVMLHLGSDFSESLKYHRCHAAAHAVARSLRCPNVATRDSLPVRKGPDCLPNQRPPI